MAFQHTAHLGASTRRASTPASRARLAGLSSTAQAAPSPNPSLAEAVTILSSPDLLPTVNRGPSKEMLHDFITVADLLQPGPQYGTTAEDYTALSASDIVVS